MLASRSSVPITALLALGAACHPSSSGANLAPPQVTDLGLALTDIAGEGHLWLLAVSEAAMGTDLDGDHDKLDRVWHAYDLDGPAPVNLRMPVPENFPPLAVVRGELAAFAVGEAELGHDLDGDADALDHVLFVYDARTGATRNLGLALPPGPLLMEGNLVMAWGSEEELGHTDLDGDGADDGFVGFVYDAATGELRNTLLQRMYFWPDVSRADGQLVFGARETSVSGDLNADGDLTDQSVLQVLDAATGQIRNTALACDYGRTPVFAGGRWAVTVFEQAQGARDLNDDGDAFDQHLFFYDPTTGAARDAELADSGLALAGNERALLEVQYEEHTDLNQNGQLGDLVPVLIEPATGRVLQVGAAVVDSSFVPLGDGFAMRAFEAAEGRDLNGDGDQLDQVAQILDPGRAGARNLGVACERITGAGSRLFLESGGKISVCDARSGRVSSTDLEAATVLDASDERALVLVSEERVGLDLNGDGDAADEVFSLYDGARRRSTNLGLAGFGGDDLRLLASGGRALLAVVEQRQGADLNGDGDQADTVLHLVTAR